MELTCPLTTHQGAWLCGFVCSVRFVAACACILVCDTGRLVGERGKVFQEADALLTLTSPRSNMSAAPHAPHLYNIDWVEEDAGHKRRNARCASALPHRQLIDDGRLLLPTPLHCRHRATAQQNAPAAAIGAAQASASWQFAVSLYVFTRSRSLWSVAGVNDR